MGKAIGDPVRLTSFKLGTAWLAIALACRAVWTMAAVGLADTDHAVAFGWQSGRGALVLLHDSAHGVSEHHRHRLGDRMLVVAEDHHDHSPHHVAAFMDGDTVLTSRADAGTFSTMLDAGVFAFEATHPDAAGVRSMKPRPPPGRSRAVAPLRTTVLIV